jgi:hypothetical protein
MGPIVTSVTSPGLIGARRTTTPGQPIGETCQNGRMFPVNLPADPPVLVFLVLAFLGGAVINGLTGLGLALVAVNAVAATMDPKTAVVLMSLVAPFLSSYQLLHNRAYIASWRRLRSLVAGAAVGSVLGANLLVALPTWVIALGLGLFTAQFVADRIRRERPQMAKGTERRLAPMVGLLSGATNSAVGASGPVVGAYLIAIGMRGREFAFAVSMVFMVQAFVRVGSFATLGQYTLPLAVMAFILLWPALLGQYLGMRYQTALNPRVFHRILLGVLLVSSLYMTWSGLRGLGGALGLG